MKVTLALNKLLILYSCKWCGVKGANSWTFPAFLTPFNRALWSLRFTSLRERELDPTMLGEPYLVIPFYYVEIVWVRLSVWLEMPTSWYPDFKNVFFFNFMFWRSALYSEQAGRQKLSELIFIFRILPLLGTLVTLFATTIVCGMSNRAKELDFLRLKEKQFNIRKSFYYN